MRTTPDVFIIESLDVDDERHNRFEGRFLSHILKQTGARVRYSYVRTPKEFRAALALFKRSGFRYLHVSCHANKHGIGLTNGEMDIETLSHVLRRCLERRRIFFSACQFVTRDLAKALLIDTNCYSVRPSGRRHAGDESGKSERLEQTSIQRR
jgi:hypothetical protein